MFYDRFYKLCQAAGVTPSKVAEALNLNKSTVYMWKKQGTTPNADTVQKIARYFGATADYLLERDDFPYPDLSGQTMTFQRFTEVDDKLMELGGFTALAEFNFLSEEDKAEALKDIQKFVEFTLSKYKKKDGES